MEQHAVAKQQGGTCDVSSVKLKYDFRANGSATEQEASSRNVSALYLWFCPVSASKFWDSTLNETADSFYILSSFIFTTAASHPFLL
jgi:hypothetical protein